MSAGKTAKKMIVAAAGRQLREKGFDGIGVDGLMREAGLTSGAFYTQFDSKKELLLEVLRDGLDELKKLVNQWRQQYGDDWLAKGFGEYFSQGHQQCAGSGCVLPSLAIEAARDAGGCAAKRLFENKLTEMVDEIAAADKQPKLIVRRQIWTALALMTGGMILARSMAEEKTTAEILTACREAVNKI